MLLQRLPYGNFRASSTRGCIIGRPLHPQVVVCPATELCSPKGSCTSCRAAVYRMIQLILETIKVFVILHVQIVIACVKFFLPGKPKDVSGEVVLITGAGSGIGKLMALGFGKLGATVVCSDINRSAIQQTVEEIESAGGKASGIVFDCSNRNEVYEAADKIKRAVGKVTILVNNAGIVSGKKFLNTPDDLAQKTFEVNTLAHFWTTKAFLPAMMEMDHGHIVSIASAAGLSGVNGLCDYCASKFGAVGFQESLHLELKALNSNVQTTVVCPYFINTGMFDGAQTRFPMLLPIMEPEYVVDKIIDAVLHNKELLILPRFLYLAAIIKCLVPYSSYVMLCDFFGFSKTMDQFVGRKKED